MSDQGFIPVGRARLPVPGFPGYEADVSGVVIGRRGAPVGTPDKDGYIRIRIQRGGQSRSVGRAAMIAAAFIGPRPTGYDIDHIDQTRSNDRPDNLRYVTHADNMARIAVEKLRTNAYRLNEADALAIRQSHGPTALVAAQYGITAAYVSAIRCGLRWRRASKTEGRGRPNSNSPEGDR